MGKYPHEGPPLMGAVNGLMDNIVYALRAWWFDWPLGIEQYDKFKAEGGYDADDRTRCPVCCRKRRKK
jgi:hypothetical protein